MSGAAIEAFAGAAVAPEQCPRALAALIGDCRTGLSLRLPALDPLCGDDPVIPALRALALSSERVRIRLLYDDHNRATALGHRLVPLARRLPSRLALRLSHPEDRDPALCFAVADQAVLFDLTGWPGRITPGYSTIAGHWRRAGPAGSMSSGSAHARIRSCASCIFSGRLAPV